MTLPFHQYQTHTEPVLGVPEVVTESRWHQAWSEPVRFKRNPKAAAALAASGGVWAIPVVGETISPDKWFAQWSLPVRFKRGLRAPYHPYLAHIPRIPDPGTLTEWYARLTEPVRLKVGLRGTYHPAYTGPSRHLPTPDVTAIMSALSDESLDLAEFAVYVYNSVAQGRARVSVTEIPRPPNNPASVTES